MEQSLAEVLDQQWTDREIQADESSDADASCLADTQVRIPCTHIYSSKGKRRAPINPYPDSLSVLSGWYTGEDAVYQHLLERR